MAIPDGWKSHEAGLSVAPLLDGPAVGGFCEVLRTDVLVYCFNKGFKLMALVSLSAPALEPVTVDEAKEHLRVDDSNEDVLISSLIVTSRLHVEAALGLALIDQSWRVVLDAWPESGVVPLPLRPLRSVSAVRIFSADNTSQVVDTQRYLVDTVGEPPRLVGNASGLPQPSRVVNGIEIDFIAGYGAALSDVPAPIRHAVLLLVAHWFEHRDPFEIGSSDVVIPAAVSHLLEPFRMARL